MAATASAMPTPGPPPGGKGSITPPDKPELPNKSGESGEDTDGDNTDGEDTIERRKCGKCKNMEPLEKFESRGGNVCKLCSGCRGIGKSMRASAEKKKAVQKAVEADKNPTAKKRMKSALIKDNSGNNDNVAAYNLAV